MTNPDDDLCFVDAVHLRDLLRRREVSPVEVVDAVLARIARHDPDINAFVTLTDSLARAQAREAERALMQGAAVGPLHGIPVLIKDLTPTSGVRTTFGSPRFADNVPTEDALAWARIKAAGAILVGKTTTPDFGELGVTDSTLTGTTNNPWDVTRTAGGSSGGSAAGVVAGFGHLSWGSDGGGSIRIPAACCGAVGLKASIGRIPGYGEQYTFESVTTCGPITRTVRDAALMLDVTAGPDRRDPIALPAPGIDFLDVVATPSIEGLRIAYSPDLGQVRVADDVRTAVDGAVDVLRALGATVDRVDLHLPDALEYFVAWWGPEYIDVVDNSGGFEQPWAVREIATLAKRISPADRYHAQTHTRAEIAAEFARVFDDYDALVTPTMPLTAFPHPGDLAGAATIDGVDVPMPYLYFHRMTEPFSHAGLPAISVPCGVDPHGMPVGLQIAGPTHDDAIVLRIAATYQEATAWHTRRPM